MGSIHSSAMSAGHADGHCQQAAGDTATAVSNTARQSVAAGLGRLEERGAASSQGVVHLQLALRHRAPVGKLCYQQYCCQVSRQRKTQPRQQP